MEKIKINLPSGSFLTVDAIFINDYEENSKIFFSQDRLAITDKENNVIDSYDINPIIGKLRKRFDDYNKHL